MYLSLRLYSRVRVRRVRLFWTKLDVQKSFLFLFFVLYEKRLDSILKLKMIIRLLYNILIDTHQALFFFRFIFIY